MNNQFVLRKSNRNESQMLMDYQCSEKFGNFSGNRIGNLPIDIKANLLMSKNMKIFDYHKISYFLVSFDTIKVGMTGFEPATT